MNQTKIKLNRRFLGIKNEFNVQDIKMSDDQAIQLSITYIFEYFLLYSILGYYGI